MKNIFLSLLTIAVFVGCSERETPSTNNDQVLIKLSAGVPSASIESKAPINVSSEFIAGVAGWESSAATVNYTNAATWESETTITANVEAQQITLNPVRAYNSDAAVKSYIKAWYPSGSLTDGVVMFTNANGTEDVMITNEVVGSKSDKEDKNLLFTHKTTQFKFIVKAGEGLALGTKITKIEVQNAEIPIGINVSDNTLICSAPTTLTIPNIDGTLEISPLGSVAGSPVMVKTKTGNEIIMNIETSTAKYSNVKATIDSDINFVQGRAYTITLTFQQTNLTLAAAIDAWTEGTGSGTIN